MILPPTILVGQDAAASVPLRRVTDFLYVPIVLQGRPPQWFILDTGA